MSAFTRPAATVLIVLAASAAIAGCKSKGDIVVDEGVGITAVRSRCPAVGIPNYTGDITLFRSSTSRTADDIDVTATMTNVRSDCSESSDKVVSSVRFDVLATRTDVRGSRQVSLPYFVTVLRGGSTVVTKRVGTVSVNFADGQARAQATGQGNAFIDRASATLPEDVQERITRRRRAGDKEAAVDPLADPEVKAAIASATFEVLLGFQLDEKQLAYNATR